MGLLPFVEECPMVRSQRRRIPRALWGVLCALALAIPAGAQPQAPQEVPQQDSEINKPDFGQSIFSGHVAMSQADGDAARLTALLEGSWKSIGTGDDQPATWMHMLPVETELLGRVIYVEVHADGTPWLPIRQSMMRVYRYGEQLRIRMYEFREASRPEVLANLWLAPEQFPAQYVRADELIPTMDIVVEPGRGGYMGRTAHAYPAQQGLGRETAVEMTLELSVKPDELVTAYTFYGLDGQPMEANNQRRRFERAQLPATVQIDDDGLVIITLEVGDLSQPETTEGDILFLNYDGFRADGFKFDSTWDTGLAMRTWYPPRVIAGLKRGMEPWKQGMRRKLIIPPELGFGQSEMKNVPPGSTLVFHGHLLRVDQAEPMPMEERRRRQGRP